MRQINIQTQVISRNAFYTCFWEKSRALACSIVAITFNVEFVTDLSNFGAEKYEDLFYEHHKS